MDVWTGTRKISPVVSFMTRMSTQHEQISTEHTATHCNTQHTATHCDTLQFTAAHCDTLQHTVTRCDTLQCTATHCDTLRHTATHCNTLQHTLQRALSRETPERVGHDSNEQTSRTYTCHGLHCMVTVSPCHVSTTRPCQITHTDTSVSNHTHTHTPTHTHSLLFNVDDSHSCQGSPHVVVALHRHSLTRSYLCHP